jgi:hypothetical protein
MNEWGRGYANTEDDTGLGRSRKRWLHIQIDLRILGVVNWKTKARNSY